MEWISYILFGAACSGFILFVFIACVKQGEKEQSLARHRRPDNVRRKRFESVDYYTGGFFILDMSGKEEETKIPEG